MRCRPGNTRNRTRTPSTGIKNRNLKSNTQRKTPSPSRNPRSRTTHEGENHLLRVEDEDEFEDDYDFRMARNEGSVPLSNRPYSRSEVIHRAGGESIFPAFERERPRIVNNFAASASPSYELSSFSHR